jgi:nucleotide-binding universal stress UspA family protein
VTALIGRLIVFLPSVIAASLIVLIGLLLARFARNRRYASSPCLQCSPRGGFDMSGVVLAYDGSIHGDWVGRYAIRLARASGTGLEVVHVDDAALAAAAVDLRLAHLREVAAASGVEVSLRHLPGAAPEVAEAIDAGVPAGTGRIIVAGLRARKSGRGLMHGTVSEQLLRFGHHDVLAIRVVSPSLLGHARHILFSFSQNPHSAERAAPFLRAFAPELTRLSLLTVMSPRLGRLSSPTGRDLRALRARGMDWLHRVEAELRGRLAPSEIPFDPHVAVSWDWPSEITRHAGRARAELVLVGSTERTLAMRVVFGNPLERVLHEAVCDVAVFRRAQGPLP